MTTLSAPALKPPCAPLSNPEPDTDRTVLLPTRVEAIARRGA